MSALGQKQTYALQNAMSALPPKADMCGAGTHVCFGPKADIGLKTAAAYGPCKWSPKEKRRGEAYDYYHVWEFVSVRT